MSPPFKPQIVLRSLPTEFLQDGWPVALPDVVSCNCDSPSSVPNEYPRIEFGAWHCTRALDHPSPHVALGDDMPIRLCALWETDDALSALSHTPAPRDEAIKA